MKIMSYQYFEGRFHYTGFSDSLKHWCDLAGWNYNDLDREIRDIIESKGTLFYYVNDPVVTYHCSAVLLVKELREKGIIS